MGVNCVFITAMLYKEVQRRGSRKLALFSWLTS